MFLLPSTPVYLTLSDDEVPIEDQPLIADASPIALSPSYVADFDPLEEDLKEDPADYLANEGEDEEEKEESSEDDDDEEEDASKNEEEEEHLAPADSTLHAIDSVLSAEETEPFETDKAQIFVRPHTPPSPSVEACIAEYAAAPTHLSPPPSPLSHLSSLLPQIPSPPLPSPPLLLPSTAHKTDISEAEMPPRVCFTAPTHRVDYGFIDTLDVSIRAFEGRVMTAVEEVNKRVIDLAATQRQDVHELYVRHGDSQDDRDALRAEISLLTRERQAWAYSEDRILAMEGRIRTLEAQGFHLMDPYEFEATEEASQSPEQAPPSPAYVPAPEYPGIFFRPHTPPSPSAEARIGEYAAAPISPSPPPSPLSSPLLHIPSTPLPSPPLLLPSTAHRTNFSEAEMPPQKRVCFTAPTRRFEVGESLTAAAARKTGHTLASRVDYGFIDTLDASIRAFEGRVMTAVEEVNKRVIDLAATQRQDVHELYVRHGDAQDDRDALRAQISLLTRERRYFRSMASSYKRDSVYARQTWAYSEDSIQDVEARIRTLEAHVGILQTQYERMEWQRHEVGDMVTRAYGRIHALEARDPTHPDDVEDAGSSC
ncbi:hypothetical protein Tco_1570310 [Tanacetum coccineum]